MAEHIKLLLTHRRLLIVAGQMVLVVIANQAAFLLRFDGGPPWWAINAGLSMLPWLLVLRFAAFIPFRLFEGYWRYTSAYDLRNIVLSVTASSVAFSAVAFSPFGPPVYPHSVPIIDALLLILMLGLARGARRIYTELRHMGNGRRVLIYGAGEAGDSIARSMQNGLSSRYVPVGFVDDNANKKGLRIRGIPVLGGRDDLPRIIRMTRPDEILIAMPNVEAAAVRDIVRVLEPFKLRITTLPKLTDILGGRIGLSQIRGLQPEDLLNRAPIGLDPTPVRRLVRGRRVMVTGAGGSIGSELCRQIAALDPASIVLYERYENNLYAIGSELTDRGFGGIAIPVLGDITDRTRLSEVFRTQRPDIIFHAAAHKHVPLMEDNPCEAVKNNVYGTQLLADMAERHGVDRFIFISTDKAVNPTSVMGATKRIGELLIQAQAQGSGTSFFTVRFGNVLASNGSVVPRFIEQIKAGGPVTVTHPEMRRYFMLIPEAVQLVLHAAAQGKTGRIYVLEMGEQVMVVDIARNLIRMAGLTPHEDIPITFTGLRPGEKLYEELVGEDEIVSPSGIEKIDQVRQRRVPTPASLRAETMVLAKLAWDGRRAEVRRQLSAMLPAFGAETPEERAAGCLDYVAPEVETFAAIAEGPDGAGLMTCPRCGAHDVYRSRVRSLPQRVKKSLSHQRLFRCHACDWRGWLTPPTYEGVPSHAEAPPQAELASVACDFSDLDETFDADSAALPSAFAPRDLNR